MANERIEEAREASVATLHGLPADAPLGQSDVPLSPASVSNSAPTAPFTTQTGGTPASSRIVLSPASTFGQSHRPSMIATGLDTPGFWCARPRGRHLSYRSRPGGLLKTSVPVHDPKTNDKKVSRPDRLNLCDDEDPNICWKIFGTRAGCPHAEYEPACKYHHHTHQSVLDDVVAKRGVNKEYIAWMIRNYRRNVPASLQRPLVVPTVQSAFAQPGRSQHRLAATGTPPGLPAPAPNVPMPLWPATNTVSPPPPGLDTTGGGGLERWVDRGPPPLDHDITDTEGWENMAPPPPHLRVDGVDITDGWGTMAPPPPEASMDGWETLAPPSPQDSAEGWENMAPPPPRR